MCHLPCVRRRQRLVLFVLRTSLWQIGCNCLTLLLLLKIFAGATRYNSEYGTYLDDDWDISSVVLSVHHERYIHTQAARPSVLLWLQIYRVCELFVCNTLCQKSCWYIFINIHTYRVISYLENVENARIKKWSEIKKTRKIIEIGKLLKFYLSECNYWQCTLWYIVFCCAAFEFSLCAIIHYNSGHFQFRNGINPLKPTVAIWVQL